MLSQARQRGLNLIEIVVTISVLGLLLATAVPNMSDWMRSTRVRQLAETTLTGLQKTRNEALKRNRNVTFWMVTPNTTAAPDDSCTLTNASAAWVISLDDPSSHCATAASATVSPRIVESYGPGTAGSGITVEALQSDGSTALTSVSFNGVGQRVGAGAPVTIDFTGSGTRRFRIQVTSSGSIRLCDRDVTSPDPRACI